MPRNVTAGVDLGGTKVQAVALRRGEAVGTARLLTPRTNAADVIAAMAETVHKALADAGATVADLRAVGVGSPGQIDASAGAVSLASNVPGFEERVEVGPRISELLGGIPVTIDNDVRVAVRGEHARGAGRPYRDLLGIFVGTGVGGGLVLDGTIRVGMGAAGEIGHMVVKDGGRECSCGRRGCLEAYAGRARMEAHARALMAKGRKTILFDVMKRKGRDRVTSGVIAAALEQGDRMTVRLVDEAVWALGIALASAQNLLDVPTIVVGGGLGDRLGRPFVDRVAAAMRPRVFARDREPHLLTTELGDLSGAVGAAVLAGG